jgi:hypothetical protein
MRKTLNILKMAVFWVVAPVVWQKFTDVSEVHGATTQKTAIFMLAAVRT